MNIILMAFGSRGDIQPFLALAVALRGRGHSVTLAAPADFEALIGAYDVPYIRIPLNNLEMMQKDSARQVSRGITPAALLAMWREIIPEAKRALLASAPIRWLRQPAAPTCSSRMDSSFRRPTRSTSR